MRDAGYLASEANLVWFEDSLYLLRKFIEEDGKYFAFGGSNAEYGRYCGHSDSNQSPVISLYGQCKNSFHKTAMNLCMNNNVDYVNLRFFYTSGRIIMDDIATAIRAFSKKEKYICKHHPDSIFEYIHSTQSAEAVCRIILQRHTGSINIGSGVPYIIRDVFTNIAKKMDCEKLLEFDFENAQKDIQVADTYILNNIIGFKNTISFNTIVDNMIFDLK
jgi:nucleoside-diphosphate-sugar epimerase